MKFRVTNQFADFVQLGQIMQQGAFRIMDLGDGVFNNTTQVPLDRGKFEEFVKYLKRDQTFEYCKTPFIFDKIVFITSTARKYCRYETFVHRVSIYCDRTLACM